LSPSYSGALFRLLGDAVPYRLEKRQEVPGLLHLLSTSRFWAPIPYNMFGPSTRSVNLLCPRLTSANPSPHLLVPVATGFPAAGGQISPGNAHPPSRLCPPHIRARLPCRYWTLKICAFLSGVPASYAVSVRRASGLPAASFRFGLATDTLAVRLTVPPAGPVGDFHP
jgi:hypothetical protein